MERRHQVFVSSTYTDLKDERAEVIQALLELDCMPAGMELFPATTEGAWELIKGVINDSDYYCLVVGGRYGTVDEEGFSYTEREYNFAVSQNKPLICFLHKDPSSIASGKTELHDTGREKLETFRKKVQSAHHVKYWTSAPELGALVARGIINLRKSSPGEGWVRGRYAATDSLLVEVANLRAKIAEMNADASRRDRTPPIENLEELASGADIYQLQGGYKEKDQKEVVTKIVECSWDTILRYVGPALQNECSDEIFRSKLRLCFYHALLTSSGKSDADIAFATVALPTVIEDNIKVQLQALGQMAPGTKRRAVADRQSYWRLTERGEARLLAVQALKKPRVAEQVGNVDTTSTDATISNESV